MPSFLIPRSAGFVALLLLAAISSSRASAQATTATPVTAPASAATTDWLNFGAAPAPLAPAPKGTLWGQELLKYTPAPLDQGHIIFNQRLRYESVDQTGLDNAKELSLRTRVGYETPHYYGIYGVGEFENTWDINDGSAGKFPAPLNNGKAVIADPRNNEITQLFAGYSAYQSDVKFGRQVILLDNQRFVGPVDWRQNDQTFDALRFSTQAIKDLWLSYAWNWKVNRISGTSTPTAILSRYNANNQLFNIHYTGLPKYGTLGAYVYDLDLRGATAPRVTTPVLTQTLSGETMGVFFDGKYALNPDWSLIYRAEYAFQTDNHGTGPGSFWDNYYHFRLGGSYQKFEAGGAFESLGGNGTHAFQTPLATLHAFNGWADQFLTTPATGLRDYYLWEKAPLPLNANLSLEQHYYTGVVSDQTFGYEADFAVSRKFGENTTALVKFAQYRGNGAPNTGVRANVSKFWLQVEFSL